MAAAVEDRSERGRWVSAPSSSRRRQASMKLHGRMNRLLLRLLFFLSLSRATSRLAMSTSMITTTTSGGANATSTAANAAVASAAAGAPGRRSNSRVYPDMPKTREDLVRHLARHLNLEEAGGQNLTDDDVVVSVIVGFRRADGPSRLRPQLLLGVEPAKRGTESASSPSSPPMTTKEVPATRPLNRIGAVASAVRLGDLNRLLGDPDVAYIDADPVVRGAGVQDGGDVVPFALYQVQAGPGSALRRQRPKARSGTSGGGSSSGGPCLDAGALRVAVIDSGVDGKHPDLPCHLPHACVGRDFTGEGGGEDSSPSWDDPNSSHGTHVLGILGALSNNGVGIVGALPDPTSVCWIIAKVLDGQDQGLMSQILEGTEWAAFEQNATIINLSIAGASYLNSAADLFQQIRDAGILAVAAAGNDGGDFYSYPASYDSVVSVGAVGEDGRYAGYSDRNSKVDLVAPGTNILSTVRIVSDKNIMTSIEFTALDGQQAIVGGMLTPRSRAPLGTITGSLFPCTDPTCDGSPGGHACIVERGLNVYSVLAKGCQDSGGIAVLIYHGEKNGFFSGDLTSDSPVTIPVIAMTRTDGLILLNGLQPGSVVSIRAQVGYSFMTGTSMSCPAVAGALAALWQACPACDSYVLERCVYLTALDLGEQGRDDLYGYGMIQTSSAFSCLQRICC